MKVVDEASGKIVGILGPAGDGNANAFTRMDYAGGPLISVVELVPFYWDLPSLGLPFFDDWASAFVGRQFQQDEVDGMQEWLRAYADHLSGAGAPPRQEPVARQYGVCGASVWGYWCEHSAPAEVNGTHRS